jgi:predicted small metal-binding protein
VRWSATCPCGWKAAANSREDAEQRAREHKAIVEALAIVEAEIGEACYEAGAMEYGPDYPCLRCQLRDVLGGAA